MWIRVYAFLALRCASLTLSDPRIYRISFFLHDWVCFVLYTVGLSYPHCVSVIRLTVTNIMRSVQEKNNMSYSLLPSPPPPGHCILHTYCFTSLSAQSWQYRDRRKPEVGTIPYPFRMTSSYIYSTQYHRQHCTLQAFEQFGALYMHNPDDKYPTRLEFEPSTSEFRAIGDGTRPVFMWFLLQWPMCLVLTLTIHWSTFILVIP